MKAETAFKKLDYKKEENEKQIEFVTSFVIDSYTQDEEEFIITFDKKWQTFEKRTSGWGSCIITMNELNAIIKQCEELGWLHINTNNENQMLRKKLDEVYDDYIQFIYSIGCKETNLRLVDEISNKIEQLQKDIKRKEINNGI